MQELMSYQERKEDIRRRLRETAENFVIIGYELKQVLLNKDYEQDGYTTIVEFAEQEYGLHKDDTYRFIRINDKYSVGGNSPELAERFQGIAQTKLSEMLSLPDADLDLITPQTTREEIRELKRFNAQEAPPAEPEESVLQNMIVEFFRPAAGRETHQMLLELLAIVEGRKTDPVLTQEEQLQECVNPKGNSVFRSGRYFMFLYDVAGGIRYKIFGDSSNHDLSYSSFAKTAHLVFRTKQTDGLDPWESVYGKEEGTKDRENEHVENCRGTEGETKSYPQKMEEKEGVAPAQLMEEAPGEAGGKTAEEAEIRGAETQEPENRESGTQEPGIQEPETLEPEKEPSNREPEKQERCEQENQTSDMERTQDKQEQETKGDPELITEKVEVRTTEESSLSTAQSNGPGAGGKQMRIDDYPEILPDGYIKCHSGAEVLVPAVRGKWREATALIAKIANEAAGEVPKLKQIIELKQDVVLLSEQMEEIVALIEEDSERREEGKEALSNRNR